MGNPVPDDIAEAFRTLPKGAVEFFRAVAADALDTDDLRAEYPYLAHSMNGDDDGERQVLKGEEDVAEDGQLAGSSSSRKRPHVDAPSTSGEGDAKKKAKRASPRAK